MLENDARKKICPMVTKREWMYCVGSACMMFREIKQPGHTHGHGDTVTKTEETVIAVYCGLAGKP